MKIFLSFLQSGKQHAIPAYSFWEYYIKNGIMEAGHSWDEVPGLDWASGIVPKSAGEQNSWRENAWEQTVNYLKKNPADIFLSYLYPTQIDRDAILRIKNMGIPCVNFFCDNVREFKKIPVEFSVFNLNWVPEHKAMALYKKANYRCINLPMPIWLDPKLRSLQNECNDQATFIGSKDIQRLLFFEQVISECPSLPLAIYGNGWNENTPSPMPGNIGYRFSDKIANQYNFIKRRGILPYMRKLKHRAAPSDISPALRLKINGAISFEKYNQLSAGSMVTVGINRFPSFNFPLSHPNTYSRLRDIEAPMLGACYLTEYTEGIEDLYDLDTEIVVYKSAVDFIEKVRWLQSNSGVRKKLRLNGQKRALLDHSIPRSLAKMFQTIN